MLSSFPVLLGVRLRGSYKASEVGGSDTSNEGVRHREPAHPGSEL